MNPVVDIHLVKRTEDANHLSTQKRVPMTMKMVMEAAYRVINLFMSISTLRKVTIKHGLLQKYYMHPRKKRGGVSSCRSLQLFVLR